MVGPNKVIGDITITFVGSNRNTLINVRCTGIRNESIVILQDNAANGVNGGVIRQHQKDTVGLSALRLLEGSWSVHILHAIVGCLNDVGRVLTCSIKVTDLLGHFNVVLVVSTCASGT